MCTTLLCGCGPCDALDATIAARLRETCGRSLASGRPSRYFDGLEEPSQIFWLAGDLDGGPATHDLFQLSLVSCRDHKGL